MNKEALADRIAKATGFDHRDVTKIVNTAIDEIKQEVIHGGSVSLSGFGVFETQHRAARRARNPRKDYGVQVPACTVAKFRVSPVFNDAVKESNPRL